MTLDAPKNLDTEQAVLGSILLNRDAILAVFTWLKPDHFWSAKHRVIYAAALDLVQHGHPPDLRTIADTLKRADKLEFVGGVAELGKLIDTVPTSYHIEHYAREVERTARLRTVLRVGEQIVNLGMQYGADADEAEAQAVSLANSLVQQRDNDVLQPIDATVEDIIAQIERGEAPCVSTGFYDLDNLLGGLYPSDLLLLAARPSVGKTAMALSLTYKIAKTGTPVLFFSLEMGRDQLVQRLAAQECGIDVSLLRRRLIPRDRQTAFATAMRNLSSLPIVTADIDKLTPDLLRAHTMRHLNDHPGSVVFIDYLQLMAGKNPKDRQQEVSDISRSLKGLARSGNVPIIALSQLNRAVEGRADKVPQLSDLRESGSLEQDADIVMFLYREELYDVKSDRVPELHIAKHRNGPLGVVPLRFDSRTTRFDNMTTRYHDVEGYAA